jgi:hypothetical protein
MDIYEQIAQIVNGIRACQHGCYGCQECEDDANKILELCNAKIKESQKNAKESQNEAKT